MAIKRTRNSVLTVPELVKPIEGGSQDAWGGYLNSNIDKQSEFYAKLIQDSESKSQEIARLDSEKVAVSDVTEIVEPLAIQVVENIGKPMLDDYAKNTVKPRIDEHVNTKIEEIDTYVDTVSKPSLDSYEKVKESELNSYTATKKGELDTYTSSKQTQLDNYEKTKETQLNLYTSTKQTQLDNYTSDKKSELDSHTSAKQTQLDSYTATKKEELDTHTTSKKSELDKYEKTKESELNTYTSTKKSELDSYEKAKEGELNTYTTTKKGEITSHTDSEILRIQGETNVQIEKVIAEGANQIEKITDASEGLSDRVSSLESNKLDKGSYTGTAQDLKNSIDAKPSASSSIPKISSGSGSAGTSSSVSRSDHVHPEQVDIKGNSATSDKLKTSRTVSVSGAVVGSAKFDGSSDINISTTLNSINASKISGGVLDISVIPKIAIPDFVVVNTDEERFALTTSSVQKGDTVKVLSTNHLYLVIDDTKLNTSDGYMVYTAEMASSVDWSGIVGKPSTFTPSAHTHTKSNITDFPTSMKNPYGLTISLNGTSQGAYDGSVAKSINITPSSIGASASSHTHNYAGSSSAGGAATNALACTGNSATATTLQTARTINGTSFNGSANITTANWGTARGITVGNTKKSVNGSGDVSWSLNEIGCARGYEISGTTVATEGWYRIAQSADGISNNTGIFLIQASVSGNHSSTVISAGISYGASTLNLEQLSHNTYNATGISKVRIVYHTTYNGNRAYLEVYNPTASARTIKVQLVGHGLGWSLVSPSTVGSIPSGYTSKELTLVAGKVVSSGGFVGSLSGNASTATKLQTARTIALSGQVIASGTFDGSGNLTLTTSMENSKRIDGSFSTAYRTQVVGSTGSGAFVYPIRNDTASVSNSPQYGSGLAFGKGDTHGYFYLNYSSAQAFIGAGNADKLNWTKQLAFTDSSISGNSATATELQTARTINGTSFDGSANITTANWGTARTLTIGNSGKSVNGSGNVSWSLSEIGAAPSSHTHNYVPTSDYTLTTISKTLTLTTSWQDTGITGTNLSSGSYMIQVSGMSSDATTTWSEVWTGVMTWYSGTTNSTDSDEIVLHKAGHASNGRTIYLRTIRSSSSGYLKLQICASTSFSSTNITFKFRKLI